MTARSLPFVAAVSPGEQPIVEAAAHILAGALGEASGESWTSSCGFKASLQSLVGATSGTVVVTSLLMVLGDAERPWQDVEAELHAVYNALCEPGDPVMICTILRHIDAVGKPERTLAIRRRIRELNLLATELSRQYGALVIDIDRVFADIGGRRLQTDYRLRGAAAAELAARTIALCIASNALDAYASVKIQDAVRSIIIAREVSYGVAAGQVMPDVLEMSHGRRRQRVTTLTDEVQENHVRWLLQQVLKGRLGPQEVLAKLFGAVRRRGARESAALLVTGVTRMMRAAEAGRRQ